MIVKNRARDGQLGERLIPINPNAILHLQGGDWQNWQNWQNSIGRIGKIGIIGKIGKIINTSNNNLYTIYRVSQRKPYIDQKRNKNLQEIGRDLIF